MIKKGDTVFVVMGNDYPEATFSDAEEAYKYCERKRIEDEPLTTRGCASNFWRVYNFKLDTEVE